MKGKDNKARTSSSSSEDSWFSRKKKVWERKKTLIYYLVGFFVFITVFFWIGEQDFFAKIQEPITHIFTNISASVLGLLGFKMTTHGDILSSPELSLQIKKGCDAIAPSMIYAVAVLAYPIKWQYKIKGLIFGLLAIFILNVIRIVTLFLTGVYAKPYFDLMHLDIWQVLFIFGTLFIWLVWLKWALKQEGKTI